MRILRLLLIVLVVVTVSVLLMGYMRGRTQSTLNQPIVTDPSGTGTVAQAREQAADIGQRAAEAANQVEGSLDEARLTTKIKAKMALDDAVKARSIKVTTRGTTVTLSGTVESIAEHDRAIALARETDGVTQVIDDLYMLKRVAG